MKSSASRAAANAPPAPQTAATRLAERSGAKACRPSSSAAKAMRAPPTTKGRGQAKQTSDVIANQPKKWSACQPSSVRGAQLAGLNAANTTRTIAATLQNFATDLI